jgi:hypothetical protein
MGVIGYMDGHERDKQALDELDRARKDNLAQANKSINQEIQGQPELVPFEEFKQMVAELQLAVRQQQLKAEQTIQQTLQQAAIVLGDSQKIDLMTKQILAMQQALNQQGPTNNPVFFKNMLDQLSNTIQEQLHQSEQQVAQALQQSVTALAQSQGAMFDSHSFHQMSQSISACEKILQQWQNGSGQTVH